MYKITTFKKVRELCKLFCKILIDLGNFIRRIWYFLYVFMIFFKTRHIVKHNLRHIKDTKNMFNDNIHESTRYVQIVLQNSYRFFIRRIWCFRYVFMIFFFFCKPGLMSSSTSVTKDIDNCIQ